MSDSDPDTDRRRPPPQDPIGSIAALPSHLLQDRLPVAILAVHQDGTVVHANVAFEQMLVIDDPNRSIARPMDSLPIEDGPDHTLLIAHRVLEAFDAPFLVDGHRLVVRPSVGLATISPIDTAVSADELPSRPTLRCIRPNAPATAGCTPSLRTCTSPTATHSIPAPTRTALPRVA